MSSDSSGLHVRSRGQVSGPLTILDIANMIAEGTLSESDEISETGQSWRTIGEFVAEQAQSLSSEKHADELFSDDFSIQLELPPDDALPPVPSAPPTIESRPPSATRRLTPLPSEPLASALEIQDDEVVELELADEPASRTAMEPDEEDEGGEPFYRISGESSEVPKLKSGVQPSKPAARRPSDHPLQPAANRPKEDQQLDAMKALARDEVRSRPSRLSLPKSNRPLPPRETPMPAAASGPVAPPTDMRPLFNGKDFSGWEFSPVEDWMNGLADVWKIEEGIIRFDGTAARPHLISISDFSDFELWIGWRALKPEVKGGIFLRSDADANGTQSWISLGAKDAGKLLGAHTSGSAAVPAFQNPPGQWNVWRIVAAGERIGLWCNRQCAWSSAVLKKARGRIGLRADGAPLEFRFVRIREVGRK